MSIPIARPSGPTILAARNTSRPPPDPRSTTTSPRRSEPLLWDFRRKGPCSPLLESRSALRRCSRTPQQQPSRPGDRWTACSPQPLRTSTLPTQVTVLTNTHLTSVLPTIGFAIGYVNAYTRGMAATRTYNVERFFQALGDNTRLRLLNLMNDQEICVCYFVAVLGGPQPKISRHLAYLRSAGIVAARREGKWMHYRIVTPPHIGASEVLRQTLAWLKNERAMQADRAKLVKACRAPSKFALLDGAPLPTPAEDTCCEAY